MQLSQVKERERYADNVDDNPKGIEYVVAKRAMYQRAAGCVMATLCIRCQSSAKKRRSQIDSYAGEPDHEGAKEYALQK